MFFLRKLHSVFGALRFCASFEALLCEIEMLCIFRIQLCARNLGEKSCLLITFNYSELLGECHACIIHVRGS